MKAEIYIFFFCITFSSVYSQTYSTLVSDATIANFMTWEINDSYSQNDYKTKIAKIHLSIIPWTEALVDIIGSARFPNSFENQLKQIIQHDDYFHSRKNEDIALKFFDLFNEHDIGYLKLQFENSIQNANWNNKFPNSKVRKKPKNNFYRYTIPLFNKSTTVAIIYKEFYCGSLCASANLNIYRKENGVWKLYKSLFCWAS